jgi:hypothetical protein
MKDGRWWYHLSMVTKLAEAIARIQELDVESQEMWGAWILEEIESERKWDELFARSQDLLEEMADRALVEERAGLTEELTEADFALDEE